MTSGGPRRGSGPRSCAFCDIVDGAAAAHLVAQTPGAVAFLDRAPVFVGHTLVIPRAHVVTLAEAPTDLVASVMALTQAVAAAMETEAFGAHGSFVAMNNRVSQSVPHLHVHVVPRHRKDGLRGFFWPRTRYDSEAHAAATAERLAGAVERTGTIG